MDKTTTAARAETSKNPTPKTRSLFEISEDFSALYQLVTECDEDLAEDQTAALEEFFNNLREERDRKIDAYVGIITELYGAADVMEREAERIRLRARTRRHRGEYLAERLKTFLEQYGEGKPAGFLRVVRIQNNSSRPVILHPHFDQDPADLPEEYRLIEFKANRRAIAEDLKACEAVVAKIEAGDDSDEVRAEFEALRKVLQVASFGTRGTHLRIS